MKLCLYYKESVSVYQDDFNCDDWSGGRDSRSHYSDICVSYVEKDYTRDSIEVPDTLGDDFWYAYAVYSTGDSFSRDEDGGIELLFACHSKEDAEAAVQILRQEKDNFSVDVQLDGKTVTVYCPWTGYFETLSYISLEKA